MLNTIKRPAMPASPIASNYPLNEQRAPLVVYGKRAPLSKETTGPAQTNTQSETMKTNSRKRQTARAAFAWARGI